MTRLLPALLLLTACAYPVPAHSQWLTAHCGMRETVVERVTGRFAEKLRAVALSQDGSVFEIYGSDVHDGWTMIRVLPGGFACIVAFGEGWVIVERMGRPT